MRFLRIILSLVIFFVLAVVTGFVWLVPSRRMRNRWVGSLRRLWGRLMLRVFRVRITVDPPSMVFSGPTLFVANHTGYLDILIMASITTGVFISREGIIWWPVIGQAAALGGTIFVDRRRRLSIGKTIEKIRATLRSGMGIVFYPEATSSNGESLLPFKSPLFGAATGAAGESFPVQPFVIRYRTIGGRPIDAANRDRVFWYDDASLPLHLWRMFKAPGIEVTVKALPERMLTGNRHKFADQLREEMLREFEKKG